MIDENFRKNHFSYIIIDEASQATEPDMLIPLAITNQAEDEGIGFQAQIVIAGDPYQLGPVIRCRRIERLLGKFFPIVNPIINGITCHIIYIAFFKLLLLLF